jgi:hypothetical protein
MKRDAIYWDSIKVTFRDRDHAEELFHQYYGISPISAKNPDSKNNLLKVQFDPPEFIVHCLYRDKNGRKEFADMSRPIEHFQPERAIRMRWIQPTLDYPDVIIRRKHDGALIYMCKTSNGEISKCILTPTGRAREYRFKTFHFADPLNYAHQQQLKADRLSGKTVDGSLSKLDDPR